MRASCVVLLALIPGCLAPPTLPPRPDSGLHDAALPPFAFVGLEVRDARDHAWPASAAPRTPHLVLTFTSPPADPSLVLLLTGAVDPDLADDLDTAPLRSSTSERAVAVDTRVDGSTVTLTPLAPLDAGEVLTIALPHWLADARDHRLDAALTMSLTVASTPNAGARATDAWPPDGTFDVPTDLAVAAIRFDGAVGDATHAIALSVVGGGSIACTATVAACSTLGWPDGVCVQLVPIAPLAPGVDHTLAVMTSAHDATGATIPSFSAHFRTAPSTPPALAWTMPASCAIGEDLGESGCTRSDDESISFRGQLNGAARITWNAGDAQGSALEPRGIVDLRVGDLAPSFATSLAIDATDFAGIATMLSLPLSTTEPLPTISITEVRADPLGPEPRQEYVEIANYGDEAVSLSGLLLADAPMAMGDALPNVSIPAGARALIVASGFDPEDPNDVPTPAGTLLVRLDASLGSGGLSNAGEPLFLRDGMNRWISAAPSTPMPRPGVCLVRTSTSPRVGTSGSFGYDAALTCTPGR